MQGRSHMGREDSAPPIVGMLAHLPNISKAGQRCFAYKPQGKSYLSAKWARTKSVCLQIGVVYPTNNFF